MTNYGLYSLSARPVPARRLRRLRAAMADNHSEMRRRCCRLLDAARRHQHYRLWIDFLPKSSRPMKPTASASRPTAKARPISPGRKRRASSFPKKRHVPAASLVTFKSNKSYSAACREAVSPNCGARASAASVSAISRRIISPTDRISSMPPTVWPAVRRHSCWRPAWVVDTIRALRRSRSRRASSRASCSTRRERMYGESAGPCENPPCPEAG